PAKSGHIKPYSTQPLYADPRLPCCINVNHALLRPALPDPSASCLIVPCLPCHLGSRPALAQSDIPQLIPHGPPRLPCLSRLCLTQPEHSRPYTPSSVSPCLPR